MKWIDTPHVKIRVQSGSGNCAAVVSKKVHKHAVIRHRYQRLLREAHRALPPEVAKKYDMVWVAKPSIIAVTTLSELQSTLDVIPYFKSN